MIHKKDIIIVKERAFRENVWLASVVRVLSDCRGKGANSREGM